MVAGQLAYSLPLLALFLGGRRPVVVVPPLPIGGAAGGRGRRRPLIIMSSCSLASLTIIIIIGHWWLVINGQKLKIIIIINQKAYLTTNFVVPPSWWRGSASFDKNKNTIKSGFRPLVVSLHRLGPSCLWVLAAGSLVLQPSWLIAGDKTHIIQRRRAHYTTKYVLLMKSCNYRVSLSPQHGDENWVLI